MDLRSLALWILPGHRWPGGSGSYKKIALIVRAESENPAPGIWNQICLELSEINVESAVKPQRGRDAWDDLADQPIQICVGWSLHVQVASADVVDGLVVHHESAVAVLKSGVGGQDRVVRLNHGGRHLGSRVDGEFQLALFSVVHRKPLHEEGGETWPGASAEGVENEESLQTSALLRLLSQPLEDQVNNLLADGVVAPGVVVRRVLLPVDQLLRVEELPVGASPENSPNIF